MLNAALNLLHDLLSLLCSVGEQILGILILSGQRERLQAGLGALERGHAGFDLGSYGHVEYPPVEYEFGTALLI
ncbi:hypothetical protein D3C71_2172830 [compost metagenome]